MKRRRSSLVPAVFRQGKWHYVMVGMLLGVTLTSIVPFFLFLHPHFSNDNSSSTIDRAHLRKQFYPRHLAHIVKHVEKHAPVRKMKEETKPKQVTKQEKAGHVERLDAGTSKVKGISKQKEHENNSQANTEKKAQKAAKGNPAKHPDVHPKDTKKAKPKQPEQPQHERGRGADVHHHKHKPKPEHVSFHHEKQHPPQQQQEGDKHWNQIHHIAAETEQAILDFFKGEARALWNGVVVPKGHSHNTAGPLLTERLARRIHNCHHSNDCSFRVVFVGSAQTSGRDVFFNQTFPFIVEKRLRPLTDAVGLTLEVSNRAMDSDLSREGPQTSHMCMENLVGTADVIVWDFEGGMQKGPSERAQVEAFIRWTTVLLQPAMILFHREGPHGKSRRGEKRLVVNISPGHDAVVYEDQADLPQPRIEGDAYKRSSGFKQQWEGERNGFWFELFKRYEKVVDFAAVDPTGGIYYVDHMPEFSNQALDAEKALPLVDCGSPGHAPPCDQVPNFVYNHLLKANLPNSSLPRDETSGAVCDVLFGCRHSWYGGTRSHEVRGELNALPLLRALRNAAEMASSGGTKNKMKEASSRRLSIHSLPAPKYCSKTFGNMVPNCITSYVPNLSRNLTQAISPIHTPRMGASHYVNDPALQINDLDRRFAPLGYQDRKLAYRLARKHKEDAYETKVVFTAKGDGPLVLCEPPCFIDECSKKRKMPLVNHVTLTLDGVGKLGPSKNFPWAIEVGGKFCTVIAKFVPKGDHTLHISTDVNFPSYVMFSHVISFA